jgi:hypothetical protein
LQVLAVLLQTMHDIIGNSVAFFFRQFVASSARLGNDLFDHLVGGG